MDSAKEAPRFTPRGHFCFSNRRTVFGAALLLDPAQVCYRSRHGFVERGMDDSGALTIDEFARRIEALISEARADGLSDEAMIAGLEEAAKALREGLP